jgi:beta-lactamase regulating signal transducer with metallopeptidase domain
MQIFVGTWALGVAVVLGGTVLGLLRSHRRVQRASRLAQDDWAAPLEWARRQLGVDRPVRLSCSPEVSVPMTFGLVRPTILLPASARQWSRERRQTVLLHELAHVQRGDFVANLVAQCACALHWVNPLAWYAAGRLRFERERACDDCVLGTGLPPTDYADHLLSVAREAHGTASFQAALTMAAPSTFRQRVESLLSGAVPTATPSRKQTILLALPLLAVTLVLGAARPVSSAAGGGSAPAAALPVRTDTTACDPAGTFPPTTDRFQAACERRTYRLPPAEALALRSGEYGPVVVEAWDAPTVALEATIVTRRPDRSAAEGALSQVRVDVEGDTVRASGPADDAPGWWSVGYRLRVPRSIALDLATYSGRIQVRDVAGSLRLTSDHGALSVTLPAGAGADLRARTDYGEIDVGFPVTVTGPISEQLTTTVGEGGPPVRLETGDDIMIRRTDGSGSGAS